MEYLKHQSGRADNLKKQLLKLNIADNEWCVVDEKNHNVMNSADRLFKFMDDNRLVPVYNTRNQPHGKWFDELLTLIRCNYYMVINRNLALGWLRQPRFKQL